LLSFRAEHAKIESKINESILDACTFSRLGIGCKGLPRWGGSEHEDASQKKRDLDGRSL
jgi:hypothetical protein